MSRVMDQHPVEVIVWIAVPEAGPRVDEELHDLQILVQDGIVYRRSSQNIFCVHVGLGLQELGDDGHVVPLDSPVQTRHADLLMLELPRRTRTPGTSHGQAGT